TGAGRARDGDLKRSRAIVAPGRTRLRENVTRVLRISWENTLLWLVTTFVLIKFIFKCVNCAYCAVNEALMRHFARFQRGTPLTKNSKCLQKRSYFPRNQPDWGTGGRRFEYPSRVMNKTTWIRRMSCELMPPCRPGIATETQNRRRNDSD